MASSLELMRHEKVDGIWRAHVGRPVRGPVATGVLGPGGEPLTREEIVGWEDVQDIVFVAEDPRWDGMSDEEIAEAQLEQIRRTLG